MPALGHDQSNLKNTTNMNKETTPPNTTGQPQNLASAPCSAWRLDREMPPKYDGTPKSWAELNRWAMHKIHGWREVDTVATIQGLTETKRFELPRQIQRQSSLSRTWHCADLRAARINLRKHTILTRQPKVGTSNWLCLELPKNSLMN